MENSILLGLIAVFIAVDWLGDENRVRTTDRKNEGTHRKRRH